MAAITWKDVVAPNFQGVSNILNSAGNQLRQGLNAGQRIVDQQQDRQDEGTQLNTNQFIDTVRARYQSPEAIAQAQASGELDKLRGQFSSLDRKQSGSGAIDSLVGNLQDRAVRDQQYADGQLDINTREDRNTFAANLASGDFQANEQLLSDVDFGRQEQELIGRNANAQESSIAKRRSEARQAAEDLRRAEDREFTNTRRQITADRQDAAFDRSEEDRIRQDEFNSISTERFNQYLDARGQQVDRQTDLRNIARESGITMDVLTDSTQHENLPEAVLQQIANVQEAYGEIGSVPSATDVSNDIMKTLLDSGGTFDEATRAAQNFDSASAFQDRATQAETAANQREVQALAREYPGSSAVQDIVNQIPPVESANLIMQGVSSEVREALSASELRNVRSTIAGLMTPESGLEYEGQKYEIPSAWISNAIELTPGLINDDTLREALTYLISDPTSGMLSDILQGQQFRERTSELQAQQGRDNLGSFFESVNSIDVQGILAGRTTSSAPTPRNEGSDRFSAVGTIDSRQGENIVNSLNGFGRGSANALFPTTPLR